MAASTRAAKELVEPRVYRVDRNLSGRLAVVAAWIEHGRDRPSSVPGTIGFERRLTCI
jgi:hypothetical protein